MLAKLNAARKGRVQGLVIVSVTIKTCVVFVYSAGDEPYADELVQRSRARANTVC